MRRLIILAIEECLPSALYLRKLGELLGCDAELISVDHNSTGVGTYLKSMKGELAVAMSADTLISFSKDTGFGDTVDFLPRENGTIFVYDWRAEPTHTEAIFRMTNGCVSTIEPITNGLPCRVPAEGKEFTLQLAEAEYAIERGDCETGFVLRPTGSGAVRLLNRGKLCTFVRMKTDTGTIFLSSGEGITDIDEIASRKYGLAKKYSGLVPYLVFARSVFGEGCWHGSLQAARLIIDDPLLKSRYGLLEFDQLFRSMDAYGYASSVAFIPWNYKRTSRKNAQYFSAKRSNFSTCIHGCDHTNGEFADRDASSVQQKAVLALKRMSEHAERTSVPCERVMVFPQGVFSEVVPGVLRSSGYLAAINSSTVPFDNDGTLKVRDLLAPAVTSLHGFPLFGRHYSNSTFDFAFDLFLGRPAFIVEHHQFFEDGLPGLEALVCDLQRRSPRLAWLPLEKAVEKTHQTRTDACGETYLRFYTDTFEFENTTDHTKRWKITRPDPNSKFVQRILVNGASVSFGRSGDQLNFEVELEPGQIARVKLVLPPVEMKPRSFGTLHTTKVLARRRLSEFRDEVLSHHPGLLRAAKRTVTALGVTGDSVKA